MCLSFISACGRIQSSIAERPDVQVFWVRVQRHDSPANGIEHKLIEERVIGLHKALDVLVRYSDVHLQVLTDLPDHLGNDDTGVETDSTQLIEQLYCDADESEH